MSFFNQDYARTTAGGLVVQGTAESQFVACKAVTKKRFEIRRSKYKLNIVWAHDLNLCLIELSDSVNKIS